MRLEELRKYKGKIIALAEENGIANIRVFGSVARGDAGPESDVDLLVTALPGAGWGYFAFGPEMERMLGCKVDVTTEKGLKPSMRVRVLAEAVPL